HFTWAVIKRRKTPEKAKDKPDLDEDDLEDEDYFSDSMEIDIPKRDKTPEESWNEVYTAMKKGKLMQEWSRPLYVNSPAGKQALEEIKEQEKLLAKELGWPGLP
ncbi:hypothetical protein EXIGLDRAFT_784586, partial [Exidia glandulosa HHB12029]